MLSLNEKSAHSRPPRKLSLRPRLTEDRCCPYLSTAQLPNQPRLSDQYDAAHQTPGPSVPVIRCVILCILSNHKSDSVSCPKVETSHGHSYKGRVNSSGARRDQLTKQSDQAWSFADLLIGVRGILTFYTSVHCGGSHASGCVRYSLTRICAG